MKQGVDPSYVKQEKYRSGNEGRRHPGLKHSLYWQGANDAYADARARASEMVKKVRIGLAEAQRRLHG